MEISAYKLTYYDVRWEGEQIRLMFAYKDVKFEDVRIPLKLGEEDWPVPCQLFHQIPTDIQGSRFCRFVFNKEGRREC